MCTEIVTRCKAKGYRWIGDTKSNRVVYYWGVKFSVAELCDQLRAEGRFVDVLVNGALYLVCKVNVYIPKIGSVALLFNVKVGTSDLHVLCSDFVELSLLELVELALLRQGIEKFHKDAKSIGFGAYRFHGSDAALIRACVKMYRLFT